jgi:hypothetical protein
MGEDQVPERRIARIARLALAGVLYCDSASEEFGTTPDLINYMKVTACDMSRDL